MRKNVASQFVAFQAVSSTDGSAVTTGTPVCYYTIDGGTQGTSTNTAVHEGNGQWSLALTQAETNGSHIVYTFTLTGAVAQSVNVYPVGYDETSASLGLNDPTAAAIRAEIDSNSTQLAAILEDTGTTLPAAVAAIPTNPMLDTETGSSFTGIPDMATATNQTTIAGYLDTEIAAILAAVDTEVAAIKAVTDALPDNGALTSLAQASGVAVTSLSSAAITDIWSTDTLTESYAADGAAGTPAQILYLLQQAMTEFAISGTTITVKKLDGSTTAATFTLDDGTTPTSRTRAT